MRTILILSILLFFGCNKKQTIISTMPESKIIAQNEVLPVSEDVTKKPIVTKEKKFSAVIYFDLDASKIKSSQVNVLDGVVLNAQKRPDKTIVLTGGCCPLGSETYNLNLGYRRARECQVYISQRTKNSIRIESFGENNLVSENTEKYYLNRRCEVRFE